MATLSREYRRQLERVIIEARRAGEKGAKNALKALAVEHHEPQGGSSKAQRELRNRLRAHGRQLGDKLDAKRGTQTIDHLASECAYEHWHRMLFARFLAENNLLIEPESGVALMLDDCRELAREKNTDWLELASSFAVKMLPQIFRSDDPVLEVSLPLEARKQLEELLESLTSEVFAADDSLGWVYQFWQSELKDAVNSSGEKIGADELPAVTQLFTEDYMVLFLLHNTLGAWWTAKRKAEGKDAILPGIDWTYLRLNGDGMPVAGSFAHWPRLARDITVLDPSMGSGHFLTFALPILVAFRMAEEGLTRGEAVYSVLRDNLFGLEIDNRCTQIAAFNLAFTAWKMIGYQPLPQVNVACSGLRINAKEEDWTRLAGQNQRSSETMKRLYLLFRDAPVLASLIDPTSLTGTLFSAEFEQVRPLLERALSVEQEDVVADELAIAARGILRAAQLLCRQFTLVGTNVPYLGRGRQDDVLKDHCEQVYPAAKADLATCMIERSINLCAPDGTLAVVSPQAWLYLKRYAKLRTRVLGLTALNAIAKLGTGAFDGISGEVVNVSLFITSRRALAESTFSLIDVSGAQGALGKTIALTSADVKLLSQREQLKNPDSAIGLVPVEESKLLRRYCSSYQGLCTSDDPQFIFAFWEVPDVNKDWRWLQSAAISTSVVSGCSFMLFWEDGKGRYFKHAQALKAEGRLGGWKSGGEAWGKPGIAINVTKNLTATLFMGEWFDNTIAALIPASGGLLPALFTFCQSEEYRQEVRNVDQSLSITEHTLLKVSFDLPKWTEAASGSELILTVGDPTQWVFSGHPREADDPLQVAVCRLLGYEWPRQHGATFFKATPISSDSLSNHVDDDGIVPLIPIKGERAAADRVRSLLADSFGSDWSAAKLGGLLSRAGFGGKTVEDWSRDGFFEQHLSSFLHLPFVLHIWDGLKNGFGVLVNYHKLTASNGGAKRTLEKLIYTYLGDWIDRQRADQKNGLEGSDIKLAAAEHLQKELKRILHGDPPYDLFVRWKSLHEQPLGWEPDANDGVRINIRPFMTAKVLNGRGKSTCILRSTPKIKWDKDRGKEPHRAKDAFPWFWSWDEKSEDFMGGREFDGNRWNDLHYSIKTKKEARERHKEKQGRKGAAK